MTCGGCVQRVRQALLGAPTVSEATVDLLGESALVVVGKPPDPRAIVNAVRSVGYDAEVVPAGPDVLEKFAGDAEQRETLRRHRQALVQAIALALPVMGLEHLMHWLWETGPAGHVTARVMQLALLVMLAVSPAGGPILASGLRSLLHLTGTMDLLISLGVVTALVSSVYGAFVAMDDAFVHLDAAAMILALVCVGRYLEARAKIRAASAMTALARRAPKRALAWREATGGSHAYPSRLSSGRESMAPAAGGEWISTPIEDIAAGDLVNVPEHEPVPVDGEVIEGKASVDESLMTGEPMPVVRGVGDRVLGGTMVTEGQLVLRATTTGSRSALGRIVQLVQQAQTSRTQMQRLADKVAGIFTPIVVIVSALVFAGWLLLPETSSAARAAQAAVAVLVVACPCALGLATPTVVSVASGVAALRGILVRDAETLESMGGVDVVVWDKTGTLTSGRPAVESFEAAEGFEPNEVLRLAASAEQFSNHPLAQAIVQHARREDVRLHEPTEFESRIGAGVRAKVNDRDVLVGKRSFLGTQDVDLGPIEPRVARAQRGGATVIMVAVDGRAAGVIQVTDPVRPSAADAVQRLQGMGIECELLTGDTPSAARAVAESVGIAPGDVHADADPWKKVRHVSRLQGTSSFDGVAMVGDGVNDSAALGVADVGIAFATGAQAAADAAGIHLIGSTPHLVADAVELARAGVRIIRQNLFWAFIYNILMIPLAATGRLPPEWAAAAMMVSSLTVVGNALRLPGLVGRRVSRCE